MNTLLRHGLLSVYVALLLSCGGSGGGGGGGATFIAPTAGSPTPAAGASATDAAVGTGSQGLGGIASNESPDSSTATSTATATATATGGDDGSGVGSGGTGVSTADATGVGAVDGAGSIIVNGLRYSTDTTVANLEDTTGLQLGMTVKVTGPVNADFTSGIARQVDSAADLRGPLASVDPKQGSFVVLDTTVTTDEATVWADAPGLTALVPGRTLQVWGLPGASGVLRATRVEQRDASTPILTGTVQGLDASSHTFTLGKLVVDYGSASLSGSLDGRPLANGTLVRVRADSAGPAAIVATQVQWWYPIPLVNGATVQIAGIVTDFAGSDSFRVLGVPVDASSAKVTGGPTGSIGNGVRLEVGGVVSNGVLHATQLKIRNVPGTGGPASFNLIGAVGAFDSPADFRVRGQPVNASGSGVVFTNGTVSNLGNGVKVNVHGGEVVNGVLMASDIVFD
jgi:hypothetical protein